ncbi:MAG: hypothetical protein AAF799_37525 [Myxococcota bacterium]
MDEEALAHEIADLERAQHESRDPHWEDAVFGRVDVDDVVKQRQAEGDDQEALALAAELMKPLPDAFEEALTDRLLEPDAQAETEPDAQAETEPETPAEAEPAEVIDRSDRSWWARGGAMVVAGIVAAAALVIVLMPSGGEQATPDGVALPEHEMWLQPSSAGMRSTKDAEVEVKAGESLAVFWRPATAHTAKPKVWVCLEGQGQSRRVAAQVVPSPPGSTIEAKVWLPAELPVGDWVMVGFVDTRPAPEDACKAAPESGRRIQRVPLTVVAR